jgi:hypothetical protein
MSLEMLLATWYAGVLAIVGGMTVPMGLLRPWVFRLGTATMTASAAVMAYEFVRLPS